MDLHTVIERANAQLAKQTNALKTTLAQLALVEELEAANPGAYSHTITQIRTRRDRQQASVKATEGLIKAFTTALKKPTK